MRQRMTAVVKGTSFYADACRKSFGKRIHNKDFGTFSVKLVRRSSSKTDYAIKVIASGGQIGFIPDNIAKDLSNKIAVFPVSATAAVRGGYSSSKESKKGQYNWHIELVFFYQIKEETK